MLFISFICIFWYCIEQLRAKRALDSSLQRSSSMPLNPVNAAVESSSNALTIVNASRRCLSLTSVDLADALKLQQTLDMMKLTLEQRRQAIIEDWNESDSEDD